MHEVHQWSTLRKVQLNLNIYLGRITMKLVMIWKNLRDELCKQICPNFQEISGPKGVSLNIKFFQVKFQRRSVITDSQRLGSDVLWSVTPSCVFGRTAARSVAKIDPLSLWLSVILSVSLGDILLAVACPTEKVTLWESNQKPMRRSRMTKILSELGIEQGPRVQNPIRYAIILGVPLKNQCI